MSAGAPWSVKGIDPKAREVAKDLARRSGMTLGEWLNRVILEDDIPDEVTVESQFGERRVRTSPELRPTPKLRAIPAGDVPPDLVRVALALDRLTDRIEASETRTGLAINGVEHSVRQALARIETAEREQHAQTARLEGLLAETRVQQGDFGERLRRMEAGPRSVEALRAIEASLSRIEPEIVVETVLQRLGDRLAAAEGRTAAALEDLSASMAALDRRVAAVEGGNGGPAFESRFESLAETLTDRVEAARAEVAAQLTAAADGGLEARFTELAAQVQAAERRSAQAVEHIGRQVLSMAEAVGRKLAEVDEKSAGAIDQVGTEIARIAGAVELRLGRQEHVQAEAFERLQTQLSQVTEALAEWTADPRARVLDAADTSEDFPAESEEPAEYVTLHGEDGSIDEPRLAEIIQNLGPPPEPEPEESLELEGRVQAAEDTVRLGRISDEPHEPEVVTPPWRRLDLDVPEPAAPGPFMPLADDTDESIFEERKADADAPELSTREVIERARAAARAAQDRPVEIHAEVERKAASGRLFQGFGARPKTSAPSPALHTALMIAGGAAFLSVGAAGLTLMQGPAPPAEPALPEVPRAAMALGPTHFPSVSEDRTAATPQPVFATVRAEVEAGVPGALAKLTALAQANHAQAQLYLAQLYDRGEAGLPQDPVEARRLTALAADNGDARAMHNLAVYEFRGEGGPQNIPAAAGWFRKAAEAGVVESQYNLGLLYQSGNGVERDLDAARRWFARAADRGDAEARRALAELAPRSQSQKARPAAKGAPVQTGSSLAGASMNVRQTQMVLARLGYYSGAIDGRDSTAYHRALAEYRRDQDANTARHTSTR